MTEEQLTELERLAALATPGPWYPEKNHTAYDTYGDSVFSTQQTHNLDNNLAYIVAACNAVPELVKMYREADDEAADANSAWQKVRRENLALRERVRELERQRDFVLMRGKTPVCLLCEDCSYLVGEPCNWGCTAKLEIRKKCLKKAVERAVIATATSVDVDAEEAAKEAGE